MSDLIGRIIKLQARLAKCEHFGELDIYIEKHKTVSSHKVREYLEKASDKIHDDCYNLGFIKNDVKELEQKLSDAEKQNDKLRRAAGRAFIALDDDEIAAELMAALTPPEVDKDE